MNFAEWLKFGMDKGWISESFCVVHDGAPLTDEEAVLVDGEDGDWDHICVSAVRFYEDRLDA